MIDQEKAKVTYTKDMLVKEIAKEVNKDHKDVGFIYNKLEEMVFNLLSSAKPDADISIRLFEGIVLNSEFVPEKNKVNNLTGKAITTASKVKPSVHISRCYREKLTSNNK